MGVRLKTRWMVLNGNDRNLRAKRGEKKVKRLVDLRGQRKSSVVFQGSLAVEEKAGSWVTLTYDTRKGKE